jgi:hypothetical protein
MLINEGENSLFSPQSALVLKCVEAHVIWQQPAAETSRAMKMFLCRWTVFRINKATCYQHGKKAVLHFSTRLFIVALMKYVNYIGLKLTLIEIFKKAPVSIFFLHCN